MTDLRAEGLSTGVAPPTWVSVECTLHELANSRDFAVRVVTKARDYVVTAARQVDKDSFEVAVAGDPELDDGDDIMVIERQPTPHGHSHRATLLDGNRRVTILRLAGVYA